jgi:hypothetical protein
VKITAAPNQSSTSISVRRSGSWSVAICSSRVAGRSCSTQRVTRRVSRVLQMQPIATARKKYSGMTIASNSLSWSSRGGPGSTKTARTNTTRAPIRLVPIEKVVISTCSRKRSSRVLWSAGPSSQDPNGRRFSTSSGLPCDIMVTVC